MIRFLLLVGFTFSLITFPSQAQSQEDTAQVSANEPRIIYYQADVNRAQKKQGRTKTGDRIKTLSGSMHHSGGFGAISFKSTSFRDETMVLVGGRGGWIINRTLAIGGEGFGVIPTAEFDDVIPGFELVSVGGYGGLFLELIFFSNEVIHVTFPVGAGAGWLGYEESFDSNRFGPGPFETVSDNGDVFWYLEPGADAEINLARNFRLVLGVSKRYTQDLELPNTDGQAFQKLNFFVTLKIGSF